MANKKNTFPDETPLDTYEQELKEFLDKGEYVSTDNLVDVKNMFKQAFKRHDALQGNKRITLRVNKLDLVKIKAKANKERIPYQRLIGALIHKFAEGETKINI